MLTWLQLQLLGGQDWLELVLLQEGWVLVLLLGFQCHPSPKSLLVSTQFPSHVGMSEQCLFIPSCCQPCKILNNG